MTSFSELVQQGSANAWLFIPSAILLGALHGLEPGHSKTMMAAFIIAIRGTVKQAALLGLAATASHTAVVWGVALVGMHYFGGKWDAEASEPYFQFVSGVLIVAIAVWMFARTRREQMREESEGAHDHHSHDETRRINTGHGIAILSIMEKDMPPRFWLKFEDHGKAAKPSKDETYTVETTRPDGTKQLFQFVNKGDYLESSTDIPEPHSFTARLSIVHGGHGHDFDVAFAEHDHAHAHSHEAEGLDVNADGFQDAHERAHANDIRKRFSNQNVTTGQIVVFGLTGGLIPCPAAITVLLLCLQLKQIPLGIALVLCFSIGLALTMVGTGALAALSVRHVSKKFSGFGKIARRAPYISSAVIILMGSFILYGGWRDMPQHDLASIIQAFSASSQGK